MQKNKPGKGFFHGKQVKYAYQELPHPENTKASCCVIGFYVVIHVF
jgi:hypothetical protein